MHCLDSYCGAQIFEIYGLGQEVVDLAFCGSVSKIGGLTLDEVIKLMIDIYNFQCAVSSTFKFQHSKRLFKILVCTFLCLSSTLLSWDAI